MEIHFFYSPCRELPMPANFIAPAQGCGLHGDFYNGWDLDVLSAAMKGVRPADNLSRNCSVPKLLSEQTSGTLTALPGCNPVSGKGETVSFYIFLEPTTDIGSFAQLLTERWRTTAPEPGHLPL